MERGNEIPKEREVDRRREVCEWEGSVCARGEWHASQRVGTRDADGAMSLSES